MSTRDARKALEQRQVLAPLAGVLERHRTRLSYQRRVGAYLWHTYRPLPRSVKH